MAKPVIVKIVVSKILIFLVTYTSGLPDFTLG